MNKVKQRIEGTSRNLEYSPEKEKHRVSLLFWRYKVKEYKGCTINKEILEIRKKIAEIVIKDVVTIQQAEDEYRKV